MVGCLSLLLVASVVEDDVAGIVCVCLEIIGINLEMILFVE